MKPTNGPFRLALVGAAGLLLAGCLFKASTVTVRRFILAPLPAGAPAPAAAATATNMALGLGVIKMPPYLLRSSLAVRKGANEIQYLENALWAEPLDQAFQRTVAANLSRQLPAQQIYLSAWDPEQVKLRLFITVEQFDVDSQGRGTLLAWWRIMPPGSDKPLKSGKANLTHTGASPQRNPQTVVATLSSLTADFSRDLAHSVREIASTPSRAGSP